MLKEIDEHIKKDQQELFTQLQEESSTERLKIGLKAEEIQPFAKSLDELSNASMQILQLKKEDYKMWERFSVMSDAEWRRAKRKNKDHCILKYFNGKAPLKRAIE